MKTIIIILFIFTLSYVSASKKLTLEKWNTEKFNFYKTACELNNSDEDMEYDYDCPSPSYPFESELKEKIAKIGKYRILPL